MADTWKINRTSLKNENKVTKEQAELEKAGKELAKNIIENIFKKDAPGSEDFGKQIAGFISKAAAVKKRGAAKKPDPTPSLSGASAAGGNTKDASNKSTLDAVTGKTSQGATIVKKVIASGSLEGVRIANKDGFEINEAAIKKEIEKAVASAEASAADPAVQEKFEKAGVPKELFTGLVGQMTTGVGQLVSTNQATASTTTQKKVAKAQMSALGNPLGTFSLNQKIGNLPAGTNIGFGAPDFQKLLSKTGLKFDKAVTENPFGSMGAEFGNIQGVMTSKVGGNPIPSELGQKIPAVTGFNNISAAGFKSAEEVPDIVNEKGATNLAETVTKGELAPNIEAETPVEELGVPGDRPLEDFLYTKVNSAEELELDFSSTTRNIKAFITRWTASTTDKVLNSAKELNEAAIVKNKERYGESTTGESSSIYAYPTHYVILRDGTIERNLNTELPASRLTKKDSPSYLAAINAIINSVYNSSIIVAFDAGYTCTEAEKNMKFLSYKSITPEQWRSYDLFVTSAIKAIPGSAHMSMQFVIEFSGKNGAGVRVGNSARFGPGFNADKYAMLKDKGVTEVDFVEKKTEFGGTTWDPVTKAGK